MSSAHSLGQGGGSKDSPPRLSPAGDTGSPMAAALKACQSESYQLGRPSGTQSVGGRWPRRERKATALDPNSISKQSWTAVAGSGDSHPRAGRGRGEKMMRIDLYNVVCGRPVAVPDLSRRSAGPWMEFETDSPGGRSRMEIYDASRKTLAAEQQQISCGREERGECEEPPALINLWHASKEGKPLRHGGGRQ